MAFADRGETTGQASEGSLVYAFGVLAMAMQTGGALSPLLVVPIQIRYGWRASFYVFALVGVVWAVDWFLWFRNTLEKSEASPVQN